MDGSIKSVSGLGYTPSARVKAANTPSTIHSRALMSVSSATCALPTSPQMIRLVSHSEYAALMIKVKAAPKPISGFCWKLANTTRNSPTKPLVPGRPQLAMAKNTQNSANHGMTLATPP